MGGVVTITEGKGKMHVLGLREFSRHEQCFLGALSMLFLNFKNNVYVQTNSQCPNSLNAGDNSSHTLTKLPVKTTTSQKVFGKRTFKTHLSLFRANITMLRKLLRNRNKSSSGKAENKKAAKTRGTQSFIFRTAKSSSSPSIEPALTWSLSTDEEECKGGDFVPSPQVQKISSFIFSEKELMTNELNHMRQLAEKQEEIAKLQRVHVELNELLASKDEEIEKMKEELDFKDRELQETYQELSEKDDELVETKLALHEAKNELNVVSSVLMKCQHELHESVSRAWPW